VIAGAALHPDTARAPIRLGSIEIRNRVLAAPLCGASKIPFRELARRYGADLAYTEMVKAYPLVRGRDDRRTLELLQTEPEDSPCGPQICGADPEIMADAARRLEQLGFPLVDINMGCPVPKVVREGAGSALLKDPAKVERIVAACSSAVKVPVTVKIRSGWNGCEFTGIDVARAAERGGAKLLTIHARRRDQFHSGAVDFKAIAAVKGAIAIPVVGNGSVEGAESALHMLRESGCDAVMVGRGAFGKPWVFHEIACAIRGEAPPAPPSLEEQESVLRWHIERTHELEPFRARGLCRRYSAWYLHGAPWSAFYRDRAFRSQSKEETLAIAHEFFELRRACARLAPGEPAPVPPVVAEALRKGLVPVEPGPEDCEE
jgi:nifR3 family TIM-barrel protein